WLCALIYPLRNALLYRKALRRSLQDPLTGVGNRLAMEQAIGREVEFAHRYRLPLALAIIDIDHFKRINDRYGHLAGDCVLKHLVERIRTHVRKTDLVFRYGGEEFAVLLNAEIEDAAKVAERIRVEVESHPYACGDGAIAVTVSIGIAALKAGEAPLALFDRADKALYDAKRSGRNRLTLAASS
ncbi:MAG: GGDEF domain-containing protein, partial [Gammaproteobacteria bacterium]